MKGPAEPASNPAQAHGAPGRLHSAFYRFVPVADTADLAGAVRALAQQQGLTGTVVVAAEGISGAVAGPAAGVARFEAALQSLALLQGALQGMAFKHSACEQTAFARLKVSVKPEIVALGLQGGPALAPAAAAPVPAPQTLSPQAWRQLLQQGQAVVLDNRNHFEYRLGHFAGAVDPQVHSFRDFVAYVEQQAPAWRAAGQPVAMYCTGGIRCEKTAPWMHSLGLQVLQLQGGVLNYFEALPDAAQDWQGHCFVFDNRIALDTRLQETHTPAERVFDAQHPDEAWRLQRARRLQRSVLPAPGAPVAPVQAPQPAAAAGPLQQPQPASPG
jgi:UPF0176 protein